MLTNGSSSTIEQSSNSNSNSNKLSFNNPSSSFPSPQSSNNSNLNASTSRYSPSNIYRAAAAAAASSDPNHRRYMPSTPVCKRKRRRRREANYICSHLSFEPTFSVSSRWSQVQLKPFLFSLVVQIELFRRKLQIRTECKTEPSMRSALIAVLRRVYSVPRSTIVSCDKLKR